MRTPSSVAERTRRDDRPARTRGALPPRRPRSDFVLLNPIARSPPTSAAIVQATAALRTAFAR